MFRKAITDIELKGDQISVSRSLDISLSQAEQQIAELSYSGVGLSKDPKVEKAKLLPFALAFYYHLFSQRSIPTEKELFDRYVSFSGREEENEIIIEEERYSKTGLRARLLRTYPSLIRDFHLYLMLQESNRFQSVGYSLSKDYYDGLDLSLNHSGQAFHLSVYLQTKRSAEFKKKKYTRHDYIGVKEIAIPLEFNSMEKLGQIYVCTDAHIQTVLHKIELDSQS
ncbi:hypothetical protein O3Q51_14260 [Cryomorphaceae bacterium 1068]|nr:hypothetical protein [Cryomorphaceae bacterium 1068]